MLGSGAFGWNRAIRATAGALMCRSTDDPCSSSHGLLSTRPLSSPGCRFAHRAATSPPVEWPMTMTRARAPRSAVMTSSDASSSSS